MHNLAPVLVSQHFDDPVRPYPTDALQIVGAVVRDPPGDRLPLPIADLDGVAALEAAADLAYARREQAFAIGPQRRGRPRIDRHPPARHEAGEQVAATPLLS